jgi:3-oxoadipate enol-lactonase
MRVWLDDLGLNADLTGPAAAPPLVLIHGLGLDLTLWDALLPQLHARVLRYDLRGHGASDRPAPPYTLGRLVRDAERLMGHFGLTGATVLGAGEGGLVAQGLAAKRPDLARALVLTGTASRFGNPPHWAARLGRLRAAGPDLDAECAALLGPRWRRMPQAAPVRALLARTGAEGWLGIGAAVAQADLYPTTARLMQPALVLAGADDRKVPPDMQRDLAGLLSEGRFQLLPGACHLAMLTAPEPFASAMQTFLAGPALS